MDHDTVDARPLARLTSVGGGVLAGTGAYMYQWSVRNPGVDVGVIFAALARGCAYIAFSFAIFVGLFVVIINARARRRLWTAPLYYVGAGFATLYAMGGDWPFWMR